MLLSVSVFALLVEFRPIALPVKVVNERAIEKIISTRGHIPFPTDSIGVQLTAPMVIQRSGIHILGMVAILCKGSQCAHK